MGIGCMYYLLGAARSQFSYQNYNRAILATHRHRDSNMSSYVLAQYILTYLCNTGPAVIVAYFMYAVLYRGGGSVKESFILSLLSLSPRFGPKATNELSSGGPKNWN